MTIFTYCIAGYGLLVLISVLQQNLIDFWFLSTVICLIYLIGTFLDERAIKKLFVEGKIDKDKFVVSKFSGKYYKWLHNERTIIKVDNSTVDASKKACFDIIKEFKEDAKEFAKTMNPYNGPVEQVDIKENKSNLDDIADYFEEEKPEDLINDDSFLNKQ